MKRIIFYTIILLSNGGSVKAQNSGELVSKAITQKMIDSLSLTNEEQQSIYQININLHQHKTAIWDRYGSTDSLRYYLQKVENERDSLYKGVLSGAKYQLYKQQKNILVSGK